MKLRGGIPGAGTGGSGIIPAIFKKRDAEKQQKTLNSLKCFLPFHFTKPF